VNEAIRKRRLDLELRQSDVAALIGRHESKRKGVWDLPVSLQWLFEFWNLWIKYQLMKKFRLAERHALKLSRNVEEVEELRPSQILSVRKACDKFLESRGLKQVPFRIFLLRKTGKKIDSM
jgi:hypothetical protein